MTQLITVPYSPDLLLHPLPVLSGTDTIQHSGSKLQRTVYEWYIEAVLEKYSPSGSKFIRLHVKYDGTSSEIVHDNELALMTCKRSDLYVSEGDWINFMREINVSRWYLFETYLKRYGATYDMKVTAHEFDTLWMRIPQTIQMALLHHCKGYAQAYWDNVIPYSEYNEELCYIEPELLLSTQEEDEK